MASGGTYRIDDWEAPAPPTTEWGEQVIEAGLNGIAILTGYRVHSWSIGELDGCQFELLADKIEEQQTNNAQLAELETDPYGANLADDAYGTEVYTDFVIQPLNRRRGLPLYLDVTVTFEIWVG
jgi:hypothetical protein